MLTFIVIDFSGLKNGAVQLRVYSSYVSGVTTPFEPVANSSDEVLPPPI